MGLVGTARGDLPPGEPGAPLRRIPEQRTSEQPSNAEITAPVTTLSIICGLLEEEDRR